MSKPKKHIPKPYAFLFNLGKRPKADEPGQGSVLRSVPCYVTLAAHKRLDAKLRAIPEPKVAKADRSRTLEGIEAFFDWNELGHHLSPDSNEGFEVVWSFHTGVTMDEARAALTSGGLVVEQAFDSQESPPGDPLARSLGKLERHLDLTSLALVKERSGAGGDLPFHASTAQAYVTAGFNFGDAGAFRARLLEAARRWHPELRDTLLLLIGHAAHQPHTKAKPEELRAFIEVLPPAADPAVKKQLQAWDQLAKKHSAKKVARRSRGGTKARPKLFIDESTGDSLKESFDGAEASLCARFELNAWPSKGSAEERAAQMAKRVANALRGVVHSSDTDCDYAPIVLAGADPTEGSFFDALGIDPEARTLVSGWDNPTLDVISTDAGAHPFQPFTRLSDDEIENLDDYLDSSDQKALKKAVKLLGGSIIGVQLCADDSCSKTVLALGKAGPGLFAGVLAVRIET